jgi:hypothetical protein
MQFLKLSSSLCVFSLLGLVGCAGFSGASFPDASVNPSQVPLGSIQGSDYGGHAPLVGAHVYVLQPSVTTSSGGTTQQTAQFNAYAAQATSLLKATYSNNGSNYPATIQNASDPGIPTGNNAWYYLQTDQTGAFNITGDYTCTAGLPVYLYLYGGSPTYPSGSTTASNTFNIASYNITGTDGAYTINFTIDTASTNNIENAYLGEGYTIYANGNANPTGHYAFNTSFQTVISTGLTTTTFSSSLGSTTTAQLTSGGLAANTPYAQTGSNMTVVFDPTFNSGVVNLAVLGNCPNNGSLAGTGTFSGANKISYVYVNEVSTVAAAYAFRPFTFTPQTTAAGYQTDCTSTYNGTTYDWNNATCIGTSSTNIAGLQNAAVIAAQLYDITGSQVSTTYAGEGHIANSKTTAGNGIIPQANINTLGNILAACVDSNNGSTTVVSGTPGYGGNTSGYNPNISPQCNTLFTAATSNAIPVGASGAGVQPFDTAMAAFNIARHPGGPNYAYSTTGASTFMQNLYTLPNAGNRPFEPDLLSTGAGQPNDFTIGILYNVTNNPATGNNPYAYTIGAESLAIDKIGNVWVTTQPSPGSFQGYLFEMSPVGVISNVTYQTNHIYGYVTIDSGESPWTGSATSVGFYTYQHATQPTPAATQGANPPSYSYGASTQTGSGSYTYAGVSDASGNVYFTSNIASGQSTDYIVKFAGAASSPPGTVTTTTGVLTNVNSHANGMSHASIDTTGAAYFDYNAAGSGNGTPTVTRNLLSTAASASGTWPVTNATSGCNALTDPEQLATNRNGDVIVSDYHNGGGTLNGANSNIFYITSAGACTQLGTTLEAGLNSPFGAVTDGSDFVYITNRGAASVSVFDARNPGASSLVSVSPSNGYIPQYASGGALTNMLYQPLNIATGPSGETWITDYGNNSIVEIIGLAYPTTTPLAAAAVAISQSAGSIGYRP